eukprot:SAG11_NODE_3005_length_2773_cov_7.231488_3_plen_180_part_00
MCPSRLSCRTKTVLPAIFVEIVLFPSRLSYCVRRVSVPSVVPCISCPSRLSCRTKQYPLRYCPDCAFSRPICHTESVTCPSLLSCHALAARPVCRVGLNGTRFPYCRDCAFPSPLSNYVRRLSVVSLIVDHVVPFVRRDVYDLPVVAVHVVCRSHIYVFGSYLSLSSRSLSYRGLFVSV